MNDGQAHAVCEAVRAARCDRMALTEANFDALRNHAITVMGATASSHPLDSLNLAMVTALGWLGSPKGFPPAALRDSLLELLRSLPLAEPLAVVDGVLAYGCGWQRRIGAASASGTDWQGRWNTAITALRKLLEGIVSEAHRQLIGLGIQFPYDPDCLADADMLLIRLYRPTSPLRLKNREALVIHCTSSDTEIMTTQGPQTVPPAAKAVFTFQEGVGRLWRSGQTEPIALSRGTEIRITAMDFETRITLTSARGQTTLKLAVGDAVRLEGPATLEAWECTCGHHRCAERHRLAAWNPATAKQTLTNFLASAVKGPSPKIRTGSFLQGMLYALWAREGF